MNTKPSVTVIYVLSVSMALALALGGLIGCGPAPAPAAASSAPAAPESIVESFYRWYIDYPGNALADGAYRSSEVLSEAFIQEVDEIIASFDRGGYDPFLCAQDLPGSFSVDEATIAPEGDQATVVVHQMWNPGTEYESTHDLTVALRMQDNAWKIVDITCAAPESGAIQPEEVVHGFYAWYLGYIGDPASGGMRNPLADGAYRSSEFLSQALIQEVDEIIASFDRGGYDPFLCAQDIPGSFSVDQATIAPEGDEATVVVREMWNPGTEYESSQDVTVTLHLVDEQWRIARVACGASQPAAEAPEGPTPATEAPADEGHAAEWQVVTDETHGFRVRLPQDWTCEDVPPAPAGMETPEGMKALQHTLIVQPKGWDGVAPPLNVEVTVGTTEEFERLYPPPTATESLDVNGNPVTRATEELGTVSIIHYIFHSPTDESTRVVLTDYISGFPERAQGHEDVLGTIQGILSTVEFTQ